MGKTADEAHSEIIRAIDDAVEKLSQRDYLEVLETLSGYIDVRIECVEQELEEEE